jgi:DNA-binding NtrC family response regulator
MKDEILIVDDYEQLVKFLSERLTSDGYVVHTASCGKDALTTIASGFFGPCLVDVRLPDISGLELLDQIKKLNPNIPVIFITAHATIDLAIEATKKGAFDFIAKGSDLLKRLNVAVKNATERLEMHEQLMSLQKKLEGSEGRFEDFITFSPKMEAILGTLDAVVNSAVTVLIEGESGTGKELVARGIHARGSRRDKPFVAVNCAGIPETLLESEMFGYEKGAFTGALTRKQGKFEAANGGTLFLDEVGELSKVLQAKLLRVLQDNTFERVGGNEPIKVDVRVIAATNRDLQEEVRKGNFREDLYYRLSVFPVRLLPLRERHEDVPILAQHFLKKFAQEEGKEVEGFEPQAMTLLREYPFPGNVRELQNIVRHAVLLARGKVLTFEEVKASLGSHKGLADRNGYAEIGGIARKSLEERIAMIFADKDSLHLMEDVERAYLKRAIKVLGGNISLAAKKLGIGRATTYRWLKGQGGSTSGEED